MIMMIMIDDDDDNVDNNNDDDGDSADDDDDDGASYRNTHTCILLCLIPSVSGYVQLTIASKSIGSSRSTVAMTMDLFSGSP